MARFPQQRGLVSALAVGLAMATRVASFRAYSSVRSLSSYRRPAAHPTNRRPLDGRSRAPDRWVNSRAGQRPSMSTAAAPAAAPAVAVEVVEKEELPTNEGSPELLKIRHTSAHVMAMAVQRLFPGTQVTIGPWIDNGFYYDFFNEETTMTDSDLKKIKKEMDKIIRQKLPLVREEVTRQAQRYTEARSRIEALGEPFKLEILDSIKTEPITLYHVGDQWWDLCAGPHVETTGDLPQKGIELQTLAGAYWRGDENRPALQRIYGTAWENPAQLKEHKRRMVEAKRRDHRVLGKKLDLFSLQEDAGGGLVFWHPKGSIIRMLIENFWKEQHLEKGYELLYTPHVANLDLWKTSGHFDFYKDGMFDQMDVEGDQYQIKPMNCPFHCLVYKDDLRSYRRVSLTLADLPIRWAEMGTVYRYERSGTLHGLMRVRGFTQDDAHIFCLPEQLEDEIISVLDLTEAILSRFGFDRRVRVGGVVFKVTRHLTP
ncbi:unnamed protein product [Ectocarpus sp. 4 AP-2014]